MKVKVCAFVTVMDTKMKNEHTIEEEVCLQELNKHWVSEEAPSIMTTLWGDSLIERLSDLIQSRTNDNQDTGNIHLIKTYLLPGCKSKINKKEALGALYQCISDLQWISSLEGYDYTIKELWAAVEEAKGREKETIGQSTMEASYDIQ